MAQVLEQKIFSLCREVTSFPQFGQILSGSGFKALNFNQRHLFAQLREQVCVVLYFEVSNFFPQTTH